MKSGERRARGTSFLQDISGDGRLVAFVSSATNLIPNDVVDDDLYVRDLTDTRPFSLDIYLRDRQTGNHRTHQREQRPGVARAAPVR